MKYNSIGFLILIFLLMRTSELFHSHVGVSMLSRFLVTFWVGEVAQRVRVPVTKPDDLSVISRTHMGNREN